MPAVGKTQIIGSFWCVIYPLAYSAYIFIGNPCILAVIEQKQYAVIQSGSNSIPGSLITAVVVTTATAVTGVGI